MKKLSRAKNTMRNTLWGAIYRVATLIGPFAIKTIIIKELGQEYNGLSTLFTSVLTVLNLANLGFNSSLVFTMYKAIAEDDKPALCAMLKFYRKVYRIVGLVILGMGLAVMPYLSVQEEISRGDLVELRKDANPDRMSASPRLIYAVFKSDHLAALRELFFKECSIRPL